MPNLLSINVIKELMAEHEVSFSKGLGQNFLIDRRALERIVQAADPSPEDVILEVGPGIGTLTCQIAPVVGKVIAVEIDQRLEPILETTLAEFTNITTHFNDILKTSLTDLIPQTSSLKAVANLPYYITTPVIFYLLESDLIWQRLVFLVQKEVAERLAAKPGSRLYGAPSVTIQARGKVSIAAVVRAGCFIPRPKVDSAVIVIEPFNEPPRYNRNLLRLVVQKAFAQRRKKVFNALTAKGVAELDLSKETWHDLFAKAKIKESDRAEALSVNDFERLVIEVDHLLKSRQEEGSFK